MSSNFRKGWHTEPLCLTNQSRTYTPELMLWRGQQSLRSPDDRTSRGSVVWGNLHFKEVIESCTEHGSGGRSIYDKVQWADTSSRVHRRIKVHAPETILQVIGNGVSHYAARKPWLLRGTDKEDHTAKGEFIYPVLMFVYIDFFFDFERKTSIVIPRRCR